MSQHYHFLNDSHPFGKSVCSTLKQSGFEAYLVGGYVRDLLLGRASRDIDIATNARPDEIATVFKTAVYTGKAYGTVTIPCQDYADMDAIQITSYRSDGVYSNQRHPDSIVFEESIHKDLSRRDFSINALAYDPITNELIDNYDGLAHLAAKCLVTVGDPDIRFKEDSLRLLRLCRFAAQLNFECAANTKIGFLNNSKTALLPAKERNQQELEKLMNGICPSKGLFLLQESEFSEKLLPGLNRLDHQLLLQIDTLEPSLRWAALLRHLDSDRVIKTLLFSNKDKQFIQRLIDYNLEVDKALFTIKDLALSGADIQSLGYAGKEIGEIQKKLFSFVIADLKRNEADLLRKYISK
jgi:tRNA nucleotidyltransferase (CCA-adding enzyme)